jgi:hypothetical protein
VQAISSVASAPDDRELLRAHEPVLRYTEGELFLPIAVGPYVTQCSLWEGGRERAAAPLVPAGELTLDRLGELGARFRDRPLYLRFVQRQLDRHEVRAWRRADRPRLRGAARFAAVGVLARLIDVVLRISLLVRGRVPGGLVAAADRASRTHLGADRCHYYGRVVRAEGYTVLQYWYFYPFNDWRSTFHGVNDHEADWEMVAVYLVGDADRLRPAWVAASSHDHHGDALRRRWDDPNLHRENGHPIVFPAAGSHSGAFVPGDYVVSVELPVLRRIVDGVRRRLRRPTTSTSGFAIPFVDYARGDGPAVGPGQSREWRPELIDDDTPWVRGFRGLWGLDTRDAFGGERAPAGPRYERNGAVRRSWADPLGWAGLDTVPPTAADEAADLRTRLDALTRRLQVLDEAVATERATLRGLRAQARSLGQYADTRPRQRERLTELARRQVGIQAMIVERAAVAEEREAHESFLSRAQAPEGPDAHLRHVHLPGAVDHDRQTGFLRIWAAVSTPVLILGIGVLLTRPSPVMLSSFSVFLAAFAAVEAVARRRVRLFLTVAGVVLVWVFVVAGLFFALLRNWQPVLAVLLSLTALVLLVVNLREFRGRPFRGNDLSSGADEASAPPGRPDLQR